MAPRVLAAGAALLLAGPVAVALARGGYFDEPRLVAGLGAWGLVALAVLAGAPALPPGRAGRVAVAGLLVLAAWTAASLAWAPLGAPALADAQRVALYLGVLLAAAALLAPRRTARAWEPAFVAGALVVVLYGLSERLVPDLVELERSLSARGRLEQPLTYWNAMGLLAAMGLVAAARLAADGTRGFAWRALGIAAAGPLGLGLFLTFSRGSIAAALAGLALVALLRPAGERARPVGLVAGVALLPVVASVVLKDVAFVELSVDARRLDGLGMTVGLLGLAVLGPLALRRLEAPDEPAGRPAGGGRRRVRGPLVAAVAVAGAVGLVLLTGLVERRPDTGNASEATASRLGSVESNRYAYWEVAVAVAADAPLAGTGTAGFRAEWLARRDVDEPLVDAHSLYLETAAELGVVGLAALLAFLGGVAAAARQVLRRDPALAVGPAAVVATWALHAALDWDWEMPGVTVPALLAAGLLVAHAGRPGPGPAGGAAPPPPG